MLDILLFQKWIYDTIKITCRKIFNFEISTPLSEKLKMLHFDANPIIIRYLVTELWAIYQDWKQDRTKESELFPSQYLKNNICDIRLIPLDHVTYMNTCVVPTLTILFLTLKTTDVSSYSRRRRCSRARYCHVLVCFIAHSKRNPEIHIARRIKYVFCNVYPCERSLRSQPFSRFKTEYSVVDALTPKYASNVWGKGFWILWYF